MNVATLKVPATAVGIGASAGGLSALEQFFKHVPANSGLSYIVVQHLDPTKKALLPDLLQRATDMPVHQACHNQNLKPNEVYVIPPNCELTVLKGKLQLAHPTEVRGLRLPINVLFSSLAIEYGDKSIAVVLSGMGSDGTLGVQAIKSMGGLTLAQTPSSAQYDSMPQAAISSSCVDIVASSEDLPLRIAEALKDKPILSSVLEPEATVQSSESILGAVLRQLRTHTRHDFSSYKTSTVLRRIERRVSVHGLEDMASYVHFLEKNPKEVEILFKELLIGVTSFFRDAAVWEYLEQTALPALFAALPRPYRVRAWCAGCSTGEEAYSLAIAFNEVLEQLPANQSLDLQVFASDLSPDAISFARCGKYPLSVAKQISPERLAKYFKLKDGYYVIQQSIRDKVLFAQHNLVLDPPFTKLDLLVCRNLLIYFDSKLQQRLFPLFHYSLRKNGLMVLGNSETIGEMGNLFALVHQKLRVYQRKGNIRARDTGLLLSAFSPLYTTNREQSVSKTNQGNQPTNQNLQTAADHVLLQVYAPAAVVVNADSDIVYISGRTGKYLEPAAGKVNWNFHAMVRSGLRAPLFNALKTAASEGQTIELHGLQVELDNPASLTVDVTVQILHEPAALKGMFMVVFRDAGLLTTRQSLADTEGGSNSAYTEELRHQQEENRRLLEENRASQEELQSSNEELQSTNEELQSTNEELTTSKEEMQSMNEELQTINAELQAKLDDLALAQSDMQNLLNSTEIAILFLDRNLNVRRYTERAAKIISLRESDMGRPLSDLTSILNYPELTDDAAETLRTLAFSEKEIAGSDGRRFSVRIMPYKRLDNVIDGVVITLVAN